MTRTAPPPSTAPEAGLDRLLERRARIREGAVTEAPARDDVAGRLEAFLAAHIGGAFTLGAVERMSGGGANECHRFVLTRGGTSEDLVLRIKVPGAICPTSAEREFQAMAATRDVLPVPGVHWLTTDPAHFGAPALISDLVPGVTAPTDAVPLATGLGTVYGPRLRDLLVPQFVGHLAALHAFDWSGADLSAFDVPRPGTTDAIDRRLAFWDRVWAEDALEAHPTVMLTQQWLWEHRPVVDHVSFLHGDYRNGNFLFDEDTGRIQAVIDWELCWLGDRHADLAYAMLRAWGHEDDAGVFRNSGLPDTATFVAEYERLSGLTVDPARLEYYVVYNLYWAVVSLVGTGPRNAAARMTQLDVMYDFISGLGAQFLGELTDLLAEERAS
ncbi:aminoglycoside phosphotransferase [Actinomycetospora sp. NBRC 106375]|uniref:phosphotransferase family protein n=1 Tax=Actinomycetospora sp. NBRC 106375 TaxID=3032207 RepID=UPI0024A05BD9|nr:phosphotransferase family protein [Actinomycetospora sp. NBRC 106375]GLZ48145.1 aminoglycoside phosphotransferase [Actinomycetospora sp. NBRC 106375]